MYYHWWMNERSCKSLFTWRPRGQEVGYPVYEECIFCLWINRHRQCNALIDWAICCHNSQDQYVLWLAHKHFSDVIRHNLLPKHRIVGFSASSTSIKEVITSLHETSLRSHESSLFLFILVVCLRTKPRFVYPTKVNPTKPREFDETRPSFVYYCFDFNIVSNSRGFVGFTIVG